MSDFDTIRYSVVEETIAHITLNRPEARNAQNKAMTYELNEAFDRAAQDPAIKVIVLDGEGPHFSSGHDLRDTSGFDGVDPVGTWACFDLPGAEGYMAVEEEIYLGMCWRWRNIPKPTVAAVHGKTVAGGLMLIWCCDLIVASDDATFCDPTVAMGVNGVEYYGHPWELGARKAKELLFTGDWFTAEEARQLGMVNHVVPRDRLEGFTFDLARRIAAKPSFALKLAKESVNQSLDAQGQWTAFRSAFSIHQLAHSHNQELFGMRIDPSGFPAAVRRTPAP